MAKLEFKNVTVQYPIYNSRSMSLRNQLVRISTGGRIESEAGHISIVTALKGVSFTLKDGDAVALVGHNGAGKSTMLRTMAGVYTPIAGEVVCSGRVATVLELGAGMDPELSGYENIVRMGVLMGMSMREIKDCTQEIEEFTQLGDFLQLPVRTYSSGMSTRLMFAVATSTQPDILLVDEIFGMGDAEFQARAKQRMEGLIKSVGIFVFASHNNDLIKAYCNRFFRLEHGVVHEVSRDDIG
ncbi:ABC transporter ATP-binding protein [Nitrosomonas europaea]|uniref:ABC transporter ATP-binding protein n=1 Tax=Nitrosomonas europaea TaxID=915 RepID=UPI000798CBA8|nr:ABC transporter ATP-binding protein [Nitrosomonas europaea]KXK43343.1 MAG: ABC transporter-like protein [Nitrosomonas europaea]MBV6389803.1 Teichoic acids export ATP-binding protein TagH [Nitrosomonas europaea]